ncbi:MAG: hypothetical protein Q8M31_23675, partial [Beijerinckiaceae bacterium]|nr:hypothetical protein [Beijerinckiaceae bacterium]
MGSSKPVKFPSHKGMWRQQLAADDTLSGLALRVALVIDRWATAVGGDRELSPGEVFGSAWRSQEALAADCRATVSGVYKAVKALQDAGHLRIKAGQGRPRAGASGSTASVYSLVYRGPNERLAEAETPPTWEGLETVNPSELEGINGAENPPNWEKKTLPVGRPTIRGSIGDIIPPSATRGVRKSDDRQAPSARQAKTPKVFPSTDADPLFDRFWAAYPARSGSIKAECRKKFAAAVRSGADPETIIRQAAAYAGHCFREGNVGERARFIKQAQAWLNQRAWEADW